MNENFFINKYEVALFPNDFVHSDFNALLEEIKKSLPEFDGLNIVVPVPSNAPKEMPRLILKSKNGILACNVSLEKTSIAWLNKKQTRKFKRPISEIQSTIIKLSDILLHHTPTYKMKRVGFIKEFVLETDEPVILVTGRTIYKKIAKNLRNYNFGFTYNLTLKAWQNCNEVITIGDAKKEKGKERALMVMDDINTFQEDDVNWGTENIKQFLQEADGKIDVNSLFKRFLKQNEP
jgi:hypothetical protein